MLVDSACALDITTCNGKGADNVTALLIDFK